MNLWIALAFAATLPSDDALAERLVNGALTAGRSTVYRAHAGCQRFSPSGSPPAAALEVWSFACRTETDGVAREGYFFAAEDGSLRLEYVHTSAPIAGPESLEAVRRKLIARYGQPTPVRNLPAAGIYGDSPAARWSVEGTQLILQTAPGQRLWPRAGIQVIGIAGERWAAVQDDLRLAASIPNEPNLKTSQLPETLKFAGSLLRRARDERNPAVRAGLLLDAHQQVSSVALLAGDGHPDTERVRAVLRPFGIQLGEQTKYAGLEYRYEPLWQAAATAPGTEAGDRAVERLLELGWPERESTGSICPRVDTFARVIKQGEKQLANWPRSSRRAGVLLLVAQAYETWWSSVTTPAPDPLTNDQFGPVRAKYVPGAEAARLKAIACYEQVLRLHPRAPEGQIARRQLPRLRLSLDTGQRRFLCLSC